MVSNFFPIERYYDAADKVRFGDESLSSSIHSTMNDF
jgi:hypothetical protein